MVFHKSFWRCADLSISSSDQSELDSLDKAIALKTERVSQDRISYIGHCRLDRQYYIKVYLDGGSFLRQWAGYARFDREYENILLFNRLGIATPALVAYGKNMRRGKLTQGAIVTAGLENCLTLEQFAQQKRLYARGVTWLRKVLTQVADFTRRLHQDGFLHVDLKWRNILVTDDDEGQVFFIDCPSGYHPPGWIFQKSVIKDLACFDKGVKRYIRKVDQLFLYKQYANKDRLEHKDKKIIKATREFFGEGTRKKRLFRRKRQKFVR